jgi:hypothetical protein
MFDDVHRLRPWQRTLLYNELLDHRSGASVWFAERTYVINPSELLTGAIPRRDFEEVRLEQAWSTAKSTKQYLNFVTSIANRRMAQMRTDLESFGDYLSNSVTDYATQDRIAKKLPELERRVRELASGTSLFDEWIAGAVSAATEPFDKAIEWTRIGILITREKQKVQSPSRDSSSATPSVAIRRTSVKRQRRLRNACIRKQEEERMRILGRLSVLGITPRLAPSILRCRFRPAASTTLPRTKFLAKIRAAKSPRKRCVFKGLMSGCGDRI